MTSDEEKRVNYLKSHENIVGKILEVNSCGNKTYVTSIYSGDVHSWIITEKRDGSMTIGLR